MVTYGIIIKPHYGQTYVKTFHKGIEKQAKMAVIIAKVNLKSTLKVQNRSVSRFSSIESQAVDHLDMKNSSICCNSRVVITQVFSHT